MANTKQQLVELFKTTLNPKSKWYNSDIAAFKAGLTGKSANQLNEQLNRMNALCGNNKSVNAMIDKEQRRMDKAGMFNIAAMAPANALD